YSHAENLGPLGLVGPATKRIEAIAIQGTRFRDSFPDSVFSIADLDQAHAQNTPLVFRRRGESRAECRAQRFLRGPALNRGKRHRQSAERSSLYARRATD